MCRRNLVLVMFLVAKWQLLAVAADEEAERAIAFLSDEEKNLWVQEVQRLNTTELAYMCHKMIFEYEGMESSVDDETAVPYYVNVTSKYIENINVPILVVQCNTLAGKYYLFTPGSGARFVAIAWEGVGRDAKYYAVKAFTDGLSDYKKWRYLYNWNLRQADLIAVCEKILTRNYGGNQTNATQALRAIRNHINGTRFMTLLCYYNWNNDSYLECCEGACKNEVLRVSYSGDGYLPMRTAPVSVEYRLSTNWY